MPTFKVAATVVGIIFGLYMTIQSALMFTFHMTSSYETPWYDQRWWVDPYTHTVLALFGEESYYWICNANKSQTWYIKQYRFGKKQYWTIVEKIDDCVLQPYPLDLYGF